MRAVINAGEHDQRADRRQTERDRQQHGDSRHSADTRQHADKRTDQGAEQAEADVVRMRGDLKAERKIGEKISHGSLGSNQNAGQSWNGSWSK